MTDVGTARLRDYLCGLLIGVMHPDLGLSVEWHSDGRELLPSFTVTNRANNASVVVHIDPAGQ
jgi:hypothetical protein